MFSLRMWRNDYTRASIRAFDLLLQGMPVLTSLLFW